MKRFISFALILLLLVSMAACSSNANTGVRTVVNTGNQTGGSEKPTISIYYMIDTQYIYNAICEFKSLFGNVNIEQKLYTVDQIDELNKSLSTEILSGGGPDVFICDPLRDVDAMSKIFSNGAFADLNEFFSRDENFKLDDYKSTFFDIGVINGKREYVPVFYASPLFITTEGILAKNNIKMNDDCTVKELGNIVDSFLKDKSRKSKYLFSANFNFYYLLNFCGGNFLDYENKKCNFDSDEFKDLLRLYKRMQTAITPVEIEEKYKFRYMSDVLKDNVAVLYLSVFENTYNLFCDNCYIKHFLGEDMKLVRITGSSDNNVSRPAFLEVAAINSNCKEKKYAYEFLKILLSDKIQTVKYGDYYNIYNPVNRITLKNEIERYSGPVEKMYIKGDFGYGDTAENFVVIDKVPLTEQLSKRIAGIHNNIGMPVFANKSVRLIINDAVKEYLSGKYNEDATAKLINNKVELFLNE